MKIQPLEDRVLIKRDPPKEKIGQILLSDGAKEVQDTGTILAIGPGVWSTDGTHFIPTFLNPDQRVIMPVMGGEVLWGQDPTGLLTIYRQSALLAVLPDKVQDPTPRD